MVSTLFYISVIYIMSSCFFFFRANAFLCCRRKEVAGCGTMTKMRNRQFPCSVAPVVLFQSSSAGIDQYSSSSSSPPSLLDDPKTVSLNVFRDDDRPVILFDGVCNLCNSAVNLALDWDPKGKLRFSALQSNVGRSLLLANGRSADDISSIVVVTRDGGAYIKSDAILKITEELTPLSSFLPLKPAAVLSRLVVPKLLRDLIYDGVADNRYNLMGKKDECRLDYDGEFDDRFVNDDIADKK